MKNLLALLAVMTLFIGCKNDRVQIHDNEQNSTSTDDAEVSKMKVLSPHTSTMAIIGDAHIHIDYSSPGVRNRIIFGGLLPYDEVWQAGAHDATWLETNKELQIDGKIIPAGKYGFFTIPSKEMWTVILNSNWEQHGKDEYNQSEDLLRITVKPVVSEEITEHLEYKIDKINETNGTISLSWEKVTVSFAFEVIN